jgi:hypothetical protein
LIGHDRRSDVEGDDIAGISDPYPDGNFTSTGSISGSVTKD